MMTSPKMMILVVGLLATVVVSEPIDAALDLPYAIHAKNVTNGTDSTNGTTTTNTTNTTNTTTAPNPCFPAVATVQLLDGSRIKMADLRVGDSVLASVNPDLYSEVFMFTHNEVSSINEFVRITTKSGKSIMLSRNHYIHASGVLKVGGDVIVGDTLNTDDAVVEIDTVWEQGLYNPQTRHGDIYVNDIKASTYTQAVDACFAHALLAPIRAIFTQGITVGWNNGVADMAADKLGSGRSVIA